MDVISILKKMVLLQPLKLFRDMTIVKYELREPTLHEIFIEKVGHEHE